MFLAPIFHRVNNCGIIQDLCLDRSWFLTAGLSALKRQLALSSPTGSIVKQDLNYEVYYAVESL